MIAVAASLTARQQITGLASSSLSMCDLSRYERSRAASNVAVLYSGQLRSALSHPGVASNHASFFDSLFGGHQTWQSFMFIDMSGPDGSTNRECNHKLLAPMLHKLSPAAIAVWIASLHGDVPIEQVGGYCNPQNKVTTSKRAGCLLKNETDKFNRAMAGFSRAVGVARIMRLKHHVYRAFELMQRHVDRSRDGRPYEIIVRTRFDCWFDNQLSVPPGDAFTEWTPLNKTVLSALVQAGILVTPREWSWSGVNDRFAIGGDREMRAYSAQYVHMQRGWASGERPQDCPGWMCVPRSQTPDLWLVRLLPLLPCCCLGACAPATDR